MALKAPVTWGDGAEHRRKIANAANNALEGRTNNGGTVTLTANQATTVVSDNRAGDDSVIVFMPTTASAATEVGAGGMYVSARGDSTFTITHANNATADRDFTYAIIATGYTDT
jgi:hypothetical protein